MTEILFYHLERARLADILPDLLQKTLDKGWRATVRAASAEAVEEIDRFLWSYDEESFLPHASSGDALDNQIWLTTDVELANNPDLLFLVSGGELRKGELDKLTRCIIIFDGGDSTALQQARGMWKELQASEHQATYWRQSPQGKWEKAG